jgi:hypothetical protein
MSMTSTTTHHFECDVCHADGPSVVSDGTPDRPAGWRKVRATDICGDCIGRMTLPEFLAILDESDRKAREDRERYGEAHARQRQALLGTRTA